MISPSTTALADHFSSACFIGRNFSSKDMLFRDSMPAWPRLSFATARYPSHLISKIQSFPLKGFSTRVASMGLMLPGKGDFLPFSNHLVIFPDKGSSLGGFSGFSAFFLPAFGLSEIHSLALLSLPTWFTVLPDRTDFSFLVTSAAEAYSSLCLISSHALSPFC